MPRAYRLWLTVSCRPRMPTCATRRAKSGDGRSLVEDGASDAVRSARFNKPLPGSINVLPSSCQQYNPQNFGVWGEFSNERGSGQSEIDHPLRLVLAQVAGADAGGGASAEPSRFGGVGYAEIDKARIAPPFLGRFSPSRPFPFAASLGL